LFGFAANSFDQNAPDPALPRTIMQATGTADPIG